MLVTQKRPRDLHWYHAGPLLFGDWGTSRLYVLGLAFYFTATAAPIYLVGLSVLMVAVAWAYTIICTKFHDGGGVYTAARQISPLLSVIGATLLMADYIVTASLSLVDSFHYFGLPERLILMCCVVALAGLAVLHWLGARSAGRFALWIAVLAMIFSAVLAAMAVPFVREGLHHVRWTPEPPAPAPTLWKRWSAFAGIILALSGVEAVANMTGIMKEPVDKTSKKTIWPILGEVSTLNIVFAVALLGVAALANQARLADFLQSDEIKNSAMKVLARAVGEHWFGERGAAILSHIAAAIFGLLLVSAANTVIVDMIGVLYSLGRDGELPKATTKLNYSGVPWLPLVLACSMPALVLLVTTDLEQLSDLYAIGVCGAISINVLCCAYNPALNLGRAQRAGMWAVGGVVSAIWITIATTKLHATVFAGGLVALVLTFRFISQRIAASRAMFPEPELGWLSELNREPLPLDPSRPRIMLAARGRGQSEFAVDVARQRGAALFVMYVRTLRVLEVGTHAAPRIEDDREAQESLGSVVMLARRYGVPVVPIYVQSDDVAGEILDYTVTFGCDTLIMGKTKRRAFARALEGDVVTQIVKDLPSEVALITRNSSPHPIGFEPVVESPRTPAATPPDEGGRPRV
jgi:amino acid transporter/nucleotide-binding universal stress UspA family protein